MQVRRVDLIDERLTRAIRDSADPDEFRYRPWWEGEPVSPAVYRRFIDDSLESKGYWEIDGASGIGGGPTVRIEKIETNSKETYRTTSRCGISMTGEYESIDRALTMASVFAMVIDNIIAEDG